MKKYWNNVNQNFLYLENQLYHCKSEKESDRYRREMKQLIREEAVTVAETAIVIVSYNNGALTKACIDSIRKNNCPETYQIIVVDNASDDGIADWLNQQKDIVLIINQENKGFPYACNQGIAAARKDADIFLLNNDTVLPRDALFWLRMGLYKNEKTGAAGSVSNYAVNYQQVPEQFEKLEEWLDFGEQNNVYMDYPYEKKAWLMGFAILIKRTALDKLKETEGKWTDGMQEVLDNRFFPGNYEDNDLSIRLLKNGYELVLCKNSFIYHYGGKAFRSNQNKYRKLLLENQKKMEQKYGIDYIPYSYIETALIDMMKPADSNFSVVEIGCRLGVTLARIQSRYPQAAVFGIEKNLRLAELAKQVVKIQWGDVLELSPEKGFDYVVLDAVLNGTLEDEKILIKALEYVKPEGCLLVSIYNRQCIHNSGYGKGYHLDEIVELFNRCGIQMKEFNYRPLIFSSEEQKKLNQLMEGKDNSLRPLYEAEKFIFSAERKA